jgi:hypothetical protein
LKKRLVLLLALVVVVMGATAASASAILVDHPGTDAGCKVFHGPGLTQPVFVFCGED